MGPCFPNIWTEYMKTFYSSTYGTKSRNKALHCILCLNNILPCTFQHMTKSRVWKPCAPAVSGAWTRLNRCLLLLDVSDGTYCSHRCWHDGNLSSPLSTVDGCVILGKDATGNTCEYATRYHVTDRKAQRREVANRVSLGLLVPFLAPKTCAFKTRIWGVLRSEIVLVQLHILVLIIGYIKAFVHTEETESDLNLMHAILETIIVCQILIIRAIIAKDKFHEIKRRRLKLEYVSVQGAGRSRSVKMWTFAYFASSVLCCLLTVAFFLVCLKYAHLGWTSLPNNILLVTAVFVAKVTMLRYELIIAQIREDHMLIVLLEAKTLLNENICTRTDSRTKGGDSQVAHFLQGIKNTPSFDQPYYISFQDRSPPSIKAGRVTEV